MENKAWAKTLLEIYKYLETICNSIDDLVKKASMSGYGCYGNSVRYTADKILDLTYKKQKLINIKVLIEDSLSKLSNENIKILTLFYIDGVKAKDLSSMYNINIRTLFRRKSMALSKLADMFKVNGFTNLKLKTMLNNEHWIMHIYENNLSFLTSKCKKLEPELNYKIILNNAISELKKFAKHKSVANYY